ncbi:MAG: DUF559 domain-containing protein [Micromonosporaceae bacterium]
MTADSATADAALERISRRQAGLFTRRQAIGCGFSAYQIRRRLAAGSWRVLIAPVLAFADLRITPQLRDRAAHLAVPGSVLGAASAARWWGMTVPDAGTYLVVGSRQRRPALAGVRLLYDPLRRCDVQLFDGVLITSRARTVFDCLWLLRNDAAVALLDRALQRGWITPSELAGRVRAHAGRRGAPRLARLVRIAGAGAHSVAERIAVGLLRRASIVGWVTNHPVHDRHGLIGIGDVVFAEAQLVIELDGWAHHVTPDRFQVDRTRQNRLVAAGWTVLRFTWKDLTERPEQVIATIRTVLAGSYD